MRALGGTPLCTVEDTKKVGVSFGRPKAYVRNIAMGSVLSKIFIQSWADSVEANDDSLPPIPMDWSKPSCEIVGESEGWSKPSCEIVSESEGWTTVKRRTKNA